MVALITDPSLEEELRAQRAAWGSDKWDEVWEDVYVMSPLPNDEHQQIVSRLSAILIDRLEFQGHGNVRAGVNVSDRKDNWKENYRCPDVAVFLNDTKAENRDTHWFGGPDFVVEIVSLGDQTRQKLPFYGKVGTRELLVVDRDPWQLELYRLAGDELESAGTCTVADAGVLASAVIPFTFALKADDQRPKIEVIHTTDQQSWLI